MVVEPVNQIRKLIYGIFSFYIENWSRLANRPPLTKTQ